MSKPKDPADRRRRALLASTLILFTVGAAVWNASVEHSGHWRTVDFVKMGAVLFLALLLAARATTSIRLTKRNPALDDELTRANRASAAFWGFWSLMLASLALLIANFFAPMTLSEIGPMLVVIGGGVAGMRFVFLERAG